MYTFDEQTVSDLHKDARGHRPSSYWWEDWRLASDSTKQVIWDNLIEELNLSMDQDSQKEIAAINAFELEIAQTLDYGACSRDDAVRWIIQAMVLDDIDLMYGGSLICYRKGLPYRMAGIFDNAINYLKAVVV